MVGRVRARDGRRGLPSISEWPSSLPSCQLSCHEIDWRSLYTSSDLVQSGWSTCRDTAEMRVRCSRDAGEMGELRLGAERVEHLQGVEVEGHPRDVGEVGADALDEGHHQREQVGDERDRLPPVARNVPRTWGCCTRRRPLAWACTGGELLARGVLSHSEPTLHETSACNPHVIRM